MINLANLAKLLNINKLNQVRNNSKELKRYNNDFRVRMFQIFTN
jgi:hypothetical protein